MKLVVDIGNTNIVIGIKKQNKWLHIWRIHTGKNTGELDYSLNLHNTLWELGIAPGDIQYKVLSTVVPELKNVFSNLLRKLNENPLIILDKKTFKNLDLIIPSPDEIGSDLVANALAAYHLYHQDVIIIDFGTALTFTVVNKAGKILGVNIAPGLKTALNALGDKTSQLDAVPLELPENPLGINTETAIQNGVLLGCVGLIGFMIETIKKQVGNSYKVVVTGGLVNVLKHKLPMIDYVNQNLTLEGLALLPELIKKDS